MIYSMFSSICLDCGYAGNDGSFWNNGGRCPKCNSCNIGGD